MQLEQYQWRIKPNQLYRVRKLNSLLSHQQNEPNIMVKGTVNIWGVNTDVTPTSLNDMILPLINKNINGFATFAMIPSYLYCEGDAEDIILSGIEVLEELGTFEGEE